MTVMILIFVYISVYTKVVDENGVPVPFGAPGKLWVRGYHIMIGYRGDEVATTETKTENGWLKIEDQFILCSKDYGKVIESLKDMLIQECENIFRNI